MGGFKFNEIDQENIVSKAKLLLEKYKKKISDEIVELILLKRVYKSNFKLSKKSAELLEEIINTGFINTFPNVTIVLRIFLTLSVSVAEDERSFSVLKRIKSYLQSTMCQERLNYQKRVFWTILK
ncbi:hypothetical protein ILUMI_01815 [Ignelater luminosus]|uniref:HAT C-terminal dimerisation domain-containing protein n=1 Tax=Ignelater luminosus TaxID=2038154 RepID=A0A8K0DJF8_IGNLU|nr:hypothetical protein ILUMI_01815 [Ignelater luminosus]